MASQMIRASSGTVRSVIPLLDFHSMPQYRYDNFARKVNLFALPILKG